LLLSPFFIQFLAFELAPRWEASGDLRSQGIKHGTGVGQTRLSRTGPGLALPWALHTHAPPGGACVGLKGLIHRGLGARARQARGLRPKWRLKTFEK
jgi:hypothetical protein